MSSEDVNLQHGGREKEGSIGEQFLGRTPPRAATTSEQPYGRDGVKNAESGR